MLQLDIEQIASSAVTDMPEIWAVVFDQLAGGQTTVREIASEKSFGLSTGGNLGPLVFSPDSVATDLWLFFPAATIQPGTVVLHAPSHVPSPPFNGATLALLRVRDFGFSVSSPNSFTYGRRVGSHAYFDEV